jgi:hypothetical protein
LLWPPTDIRLLGTSKRDNVVEQAVVVSNGGVGCMVWCTWCEPNPIQELRAQLEMWWHKTRVR